jgi:hypothetical protein
VNPTASLRATARRFGAAGAALLLSLISCGREITGPNGGVRFAEGLSFVSLFPGELASVEEGAGSVVPYTSVRVTLTRANGSVALARVFPISSDVPEFQAALGVQLSPDAPAEGEAFDLALQYINAAGDTVFRGGPEPVLARPLRRGEPPPQPTPVELTYSGPGASATDVEILPDTIQLVAGAPFAFTATARDGQGGTVADAPLLFSALDTSRATVSAIGAGAGVSRPSRGIARVRVALAAGSAADTGIIVITPKPANLARVGASPLAGVAGSAIGDSVVVRLLATDGLPIAGANVNVVIAGGGATNDSSFVTDADGRVALRWSLGGVIGTAAQSLTFSSAGVSDLTLTADVSAALLPASRLVITQQPTTAVSGQVFATAVIVQAVDSTGAVATNFASNILLNVIELPLNGSIAGPNGIIAVNGISTYASLIPSKVGTYRFTATAAGLTPDTSDAIVVSAGAPTAIAVQSGNGQSANVGTALTLPIVVRVADAADNPVPNRAVTFAVTSGGGSLTGAVDTTDAAGLATLGSWTLGTTVGAQSITAAVAGVAPVTITATGIALAPVINLSIVSSNVIGFQRTGQLAVELGQPAPVGGLVVSVVSDSAQFLTVAPPASVTIAAGDTLATIDVTGVAVGLARVRGTAAGWTPDTLDVPVSLNLISLPLTLNAPLDGTASLPVQLSTPAPAGGVGVTLTVTAPAIASVSPNPVVVLSGASTQNTNVQGLQIGSTTITATHPNYAPATTTVNVTASVDIQQTVVALNESFNAPITVRLLSGGNPVPAPAGGIAISLTSVNPLCASVPSSTTIGAGLTSVAVTVAKGSGTTFPCSTFIRAAGPLGFVGDSTTANVGAIPTIASAPMVIGSGLQRQQSVALGFAAHGGTTVRVESSDPAKVLISANTTTAGSAFVDFPLANGAVNANYTLQALEGILDDSATVIITAPGFAPDTNKITILQAAFEITGLASPRTTSQADDAFQVRVGTPISAISTGFTAIDELRVGAPTLVFSLVNDSAAVADLVTTAVTGDSVTVSIVAGASDSPISVAAGGVAVRSTAAGITSIRAHSATLRPLPGGTRSVTINQSAISGSSGIGFAQPIGRGLMRTATIVLSNAVVGSPLPITVKPSRPGLVVLAPTNGIVGSPDSTVVTVAVGNSTASISVQVLETAGPALDSLTLISTAPGYADGSAVVGIVDPVLLISADLSLTGTTSASDDPFTLSVGSPLNAAANTIAFGDFVRAGSAGLPVNVIVDSVAVGTLVTTARVADSVQLVIPAGDRFSASSVALGGAAFRYLAGGVTTVRANSALTRELTTATRTVTVTAPSINGLTSFGIGSGLQRSATINLDSPAPAGGLPVMLTASEPGRLLFAPNATTVGSDTLIVTVNAGQISAGVVIQALDVLPDTVVATASSPGWTSRTANYFIWQPVIELASVLTPVTTLSPDDAFVVQIGSPSSPIGNFISSGNPRRAGAPPYPVTFATSNGNVGKLVINGAVADTQVVNILAGAVQTAGTAPTGVFFRPLTTGTTVLSATAPGARQGVNAAGTTVTVTTPGIALGALTTVGSGLQSSTGATVSLGAINHGGVTVIVKSSNPDVLKVARLAGDVATDSIIVPVANGTGFFNYVIAGMEGQTGSVQVSARADGFTDGTTTATVVQPTLEIVSLGTSLVAGAADRAFQVRLGQLNAGGTALNQVQSIRTGGTPITVSFTTSNAAALPLITSSTNGASATLTIAPGANSSASQVVNGGVAARPLAPGVSAVSATSPGYAVVGGATVTVTVAPP